MSKLEALGAAKVRSSRLTLAADGCKHREGQMSKKKLLLPRKTLNRLRLRAQMTAARQEYADAQADCRLWLSRVNAARQQLEAAEKRREFAGGRLWELVKVTEVNAPLDSMAVAVKAAKKQRKLWQKANCL